MVTHRKLEVYVVSRSRPQRSTTLEYLDDCADLLIKLVVPAYQKRDYYDLADKHATDLIGCPVDGIAKTRQFCGQNCKSDRFIMFDDDLRFFKRVDDKDWHLVKVEEGDINRMLVDVENYLDEYAHVGISARQANNGLRYPGKKCSRPLRALAYRKEEFLKVKHGRVDIMEDFDVTLQLLKMGYANFVFSRWSQDQNTTQMTGGCSDYRTLELHNRNVEKMVKLHGRFVKMKEKDYKSGGSISKRKELIIYWQKAWESTQK